MTEVSKNLDTLFTSARTCGRCANYNCCSAVACLLSIKQIVLHQTIPTQFNLSRNKNRVKIYLDIAHKVRIGSQMI